MRKTSFVIVILIILVAIIYGLINQIFTALRSGDRLSEVLNSLQQLQIKNQALKKSLKEAASPQFIEQQARDQLGLMRDGEVMVVIPEEIIQKALQQEQPVVVPFPNPIGWWRVFFK